MDQVRTILKVLWQQRFWVLSCIGTLTAVICWMSASGTLVEEFKKRQSSIKGSFSSVQSISGQPQLPNQKVIDGNSEQVNLESKITLSIWEELYGRQHEEVLYWPKDHLDEGFIEEIEKLKFGDTFPNSKAQFMINNYRNYIGKRFDGMLDIVKALKLADGARPRSRGGAGEREFGGEGGYPGQFGRGASVPDEEQEDYLVQWLDQGNLQEQLEFTGKPTALQIWVTQENLWVYETLLNVIANTNKVRGASRPDNSAVRVIVALEVGQDAISGAKSQGNIVAPLGGTSQSSGGEGGYNRGGEGGYNRGGEGGYGRGGEGGYNRGGEGGEEDDGQLLAFRYLDPSTGEPLSGDAEGFESEFRLLPVRMVLMMEQSWLPHVIVECANASLPVEVKKLRVNPDQSGAGFGTTGARGGSRRQNSARVATDKSLIEVELQGVVYIFNKPDKSRLGITEEEQFADASGSTVQR